MAIDSATSIGQQQVRQAQPVEKPVPNTLPEPVQPPDKAVTDAQERTQTLPQGNAKRVEGSTAIQAQESPPPSQAAIYRDRQSDARAPAPPSAADQTPANTNIEPAPPQPAAVPKSTSQVRESVSESQPRSTEARQQQAADVEQQTQRSQAVADAYATRSEQTGADQSQEPPTLNINA